MRRILILGSTGSIGTQALDVVRAAPEGTFEIVGLAAGRQWEPYQSQINNGRLAVKLGSQLNTRTGEQFQTVTVRITPKGATALAIRYGVMPKTVADLLAGDPEAGAA